MSDVLITVRHTEPGNYEAVHKIFTYPKAVWGTLQLPFPSVEAWRKRLAEQSAGRYSLVACVGEEIVGQLGLWTETSPRRRHVGSLGMAVRDDWQGKGVGSSLMQAAVELADRWLGLTRLELTVYTDNQPAVQLYEKFGFVTEGIHRHIGMTPKRGAALTAGLEVAQARRRE